MYLARPVTSGDPTHLPSRAALAKDLLTLAIPIALGFVGTNLMSLVDTAMVRPLGAAAVGAVGLGGAIYSFALLAGIGLLLGVDRAAAVALGAGRRDDVPRALVGGVFLAVCAGAPLALLLRLASAHVGALGVAPELVPIASSYLGTLAPAIIPALIFTAARLTLQALDDTAAATAILFLANLVNALADYGFIRGRFGLPSLGASGAAVATVISQCFMVLAIFMWLARKEIGVLRVGFRPDPAMMRELLRLGLPAAAHLLLEVGGFSMVALLAARISAISAAAHQVVIQIASFTFMVPLGLSLAGSVRVGHSLGRGDPALAKRFGDVTVLLGASFMAASGLTLALAWRPILGVFVEDPAVLSLARGMLVVAALFQLFDGMQVTLSGALRGAGDARSSMYGNLLGHWGVGLPIGCLLAFGAGMGVLGLWIGLALGLGSVAMFLLHRWTRRWRDALPAAT